MSTITNTRHRRLIQDLEAKSGVKFASTGHTKNGHLRLVLNNNTILNEDVRRNYPRR